MLLAALLVLIASHGFCERIPDEPNLSPVTAKKQGSPGEASAPELAAQGPKQAEKSEAAAGIALTGRYSLQVEDLNEKQLHALIASVDATGRTEMAAVQGPDKKITVFRLLVANFRDPESAKKKLAKLREIRDSGFVMQNKDQSYSLYASSYFDEKSALKEKARLAKAGIPTTLKTMHVTLPTYLLLFGNFPSQEAAQEAAARLQKLNLKAVVIENPQEAPKKP